MIEITEKGNFNNTERWLAGLSSGDAFNALNKYGDRGVRALADATPQDTGRAASSWYYSIIQTPGYYSIRWHNDDIEDGFPVAVMIQYGHGTGTGGWVEGRDYIMPAILPIFDAIVNEAWREVMKS